MTDEEINKIVDVDSLKNNFIHKVGNCYLTQDEQKILERYNINYMNCKSNKELIYMIEEYLEIEENEELEWLSDNLAERSYYFDTNK